jgi:LysR family hydrogen peroxide-inducible transcriptional activator
MNIRDLQYALKVSELGHFGRAAEACHVSQPALSGQIQKLERELGVMLFERTKRQVRVTPVGERILAHARDLLALVTVIEETANAHKDPLSGILRLGLIPTIGPYLTPLLLPSLSHGLPKMDLSLTEGMTHVLEKQLLDGEIDAAILATPVTDSHLTETPLYVEPFWIALPHGHALEDQETVSVLDIKSDDLLLLADGHCLRDQILQFCDRTRGANKSFNTQNTSLATLLALVGAGAGVTLVPAMSLQSAWLTDAGIAVRREKTGKASRSVVLAYRKSFPRHQILEKLADIVCAILPDTVMPERR